MRLRRSLFALMVVVAAVALEGHSTLSPFERIDRELRSISTRLGTTAVALEVWQHGRPLRSRRYGPDGLVNAGSGRKAVTAAVVMSLVEDGLVELDEGISLPGWGHARFTMRQLLSHTAGLPDKPARGACQGVESLAACTEAAGVATFQIYDPGAAFSYSSLGYQLAARHAEVASGQMWSELVDERILGPLEMVATTHRMAGAGLTEMDGQLMTTPTDYARFLQMLLDEGMYRGTRILERSSVRALEADQLDVAGRKRVSGRLKWHKSHPPYGLGLWRIAVDEAGSARISGTEGRGGFRGWVDRDNDVVGVLAVSRPGNVSIRVGALAKWVALAVEPRL